MALHVHKVNTITRRSMYSLQANESFSTEAYNYFHSKNDKASAIKHDDWEAKQTIGPKECISSNCKYSIEGLGVSTSNMNDSINSTGSIGKSTKRSRLCRREHNEICTKEEYRLRDLKEDIKDSFFGVSQIMLDSGGKDSTSTIIMNSNKLVSHCKELARNDNIVPGSKMVRKPGLNDVLCGRGGYINHHAGNKKYRALVNSKKEEYLNAPKGEKQHVSQNIVDIIRNQNPPGHFLQQNVKSKIWFDIGNTKAREKTSHALREGAPMLRNKIKRKHDFNGSDDRFVGSALPTKVARVLTPEESDEYELLKRSQKNMKATFAHEERIAKSILCYESLGKQVLDLINRSSLYHPSTMSMKISQQNTIYLKTGMRL